MQLLSLAQKPLSHAFCPQCSHLFPCTALMPRAPKQALPWQSRIKELEIALEGLRQQQRESRLKAEAATKQAATHKAELDSARTRLQQLQQASMCTLCVSL